GLWVAPRLMQDGWFERSIFVWGWAIGAVSTGIALLRVVDPALKSGTLEDFGVAYLPVVPVEITAVTFVPPPRVGRGSVGCGRHLGCHRGGRRHSRNLYREGKYARHTTCVTFRVPARSAASTATPVRARWAEFQPRVWCGMPYQAS